MLAAHFYYGRSGYILAHISMTTRARDFKFAGAIVQRLYLVMVALTKNRLSAQYGWFCHGRSHFSTAETTNLQTTVFARNRENLGVLVNKPFTNWVKVNNVCGGHATNGFHIRAVEAGLDFQRLIEQPELNIDVCMNTQLFNRIQENCHIIRCCAECIFYCGRQCIALRGDTERLNQPGNPGNFLAMLTVVANHDPVLKAHLENPRLRNATYISPHTQNEIIDIIGKKIIQNSIIKEII